MRSERESGQSVKVGDTTAESETITIRGTLPNMYWRNTTNSNNAGPPETQPRERAMMESSSSTKGFTGYYSKSKRGTE